VAGSWRIYYDTGATFGDSDGAWSDAPGEGVLAVVELIDGALTVHSGHDYYQIEDDSIVMRDERTLLAAVGVLDMSPIKFGRYTSAKKMAAVFRRIREEWGGG
jgi:hypothetical protein